VSPYQRIIGRFYLIGLVAGAYLIAGPIWFAAGTHKALIRILQRPESSRT
jgi:hypothetical protein